MALHNSPKTAALGKRRWSLVHLLAQEVINASKSQTELLPCLSHENSNTAVKDT